jgi:hypothetical protein
MFQLLTPLSQGETCLVIRMRSVCSRNFPASGPPSFGEAYLGHSLIKSHDLNVYECAEKWGTTSVQTPTPKNQDPAPASSLSPYMFGHRLST